LSSCSTAAMPPHAVEDVLRRPDFFTNLRKKFSSNLLSDNKRAITFDSVHDSVPNSCAPHAHQDEWLENNNIHAAGEHGDTDTCRNEKLNQIDIFPATPPRCQSIVSTSTLFQREDVVPKPSALPSLQPAHRRNVKLPGKERTLSPARSSRRTKSLDLEASDGACAKFPQLPEACLPERASRSPRERHWQEDRQGQQEAGVGLRAQPPPSLAPRPPSMPSPRPPSMQDPGQDSPKASPASRLSSNTTLSHRHRRLVELEGGGEGAARTPGGSGELVGSWRRMSLDDEVADGIRPDICPEPTGHEKAVRLRAATMHARVSRPDSYRPR